MSSPAPTSSIAKAFELLEHLAAANRALSLQEVVDGVRLPKPTACRLLRTLHDLGYVSRPPGGRDYLVGPRTARLAAADPHAAIKAVAIPHLKTLHETFNESTNLAVLSGQEVLYLKVLETTQALRFSLPPGGRDPYYRTALGRATAAKLPEARWKKLLAETQIEPLTPRTVRSRRALQAHIAKTRRLGYAEEIEESVAGVTCLAADLGGLGFPEAAISLAVPIQRLTPERRTAIIRGLKALSKPKKTT